MIGNALRPRSQASHRLGGVRAAAAELTRGLRLTLVLAAVALLSRTGAATKYVSKQGSDTNDGDTRATAYRTIAHALREIGAGGTLYLAGGTYAEAIINTIPSGTSEDARMTVTNLPGETVILRPERGPARVLEFIGNVGYITVAGHAPGEVVLDGALVAHNVVKFSTRASGGRGDRPAHIRLENLEIKHGHDSAVLGFAQSSEFRRLAIQHSGTTVFDHGMYLTGTDNLIEDCDIHHNFSRGIQIYMEGKRGDVGSASRNTVRNCRIHDNGRGNPAALKPGIDVDSGVGNLIYNNLIYDNGQIGLMIQSGGTAGMIFHNTFLRNGGPAIFIKATAGSGNVVRNNLARQSGSGPAFVNERNDVSASHNLWDADPHFASTDPTTTVFLQLTAESHAAIDRGTTESPIGTLVTRDYFGAARPAGAGHDIGAAEYGPVTRAAAQSRSSHQ